MIPVPVTKCKGCEISFQPTNRRQKFHDKQCGKKFHSKINTTKNNKRSNIKSIFSFHNRVKRVCLKCGLDFMSDGKWNKICKECKRGQEFDSHSILYNP